MGGGERIGELAVPCDPKSATRGDPLTREAVTQPGVGPDMPTLSS